jgi:hypothetical protein
MPRLARWIEVYGLYQSAPYFTAGVVSGLTVAVYDLVCVYSKSMLCVDTAQLSLRSLLLPPSLRNSIVLV